MLNATKVKLAITDVDGVMRGKYVSRAKFDKIISSGFGFCNVVFGWDANDAPYDNTKLIGDHTGYNDGHATVDISTKRTLKEDQGEFYLSDFCTDPTLQYICPRSILRRVSSKANALGFTANFANEFEWFNFKENGQTLREKNFTHLNPITHGMFGYSLSKLSENEAYVNAIISELDSLDIPIEGLHTETGDGVYEAAITYSDIVLAADRATLFKQTVKEVALKHGVTATFMAKWNETLPGCGGHIHQSLANSEGKNQFFDEKGRYGLSIIGEQYLAGVMHCLPFLMPIFAPNINSYKRYIAGSWAATSASWGIDNRTTALRLINSGEGTRIEVRVPGADTNPYLTMAACLAAGLYGIEKELLLDQNPIQGSAYNKSEYTPLPSNLRDAVTLMNSSSLALELLGKDFIDHYSSTRIWECQQYEKAVTTWELQRYLEII